MNRALLRSIMVLMCWWYHKTEIMTRKPKQEPHKPAKFKPALEQATAVIIICELSRECTKLGGKAVLCRLVITYE